MRGRIAKIHQQTIAQILAMLINPMSAITPMCTETATFAANLQRANWYTEDAVDEWTMSCYFVNAFGHRTILPVIMSVIVWCFLLVSCDQFRQSMIVIHFGNWKPDIWTFTPEKIVFLTCMYNLLWKYCIFRYEWLLCLCLEHIFQCDWKSTVLHFYT